MELKRLMKLLLCAEIQSIVQPYVGEKNNAEMRKEIARRIMQKQRKLNRVIKEQRN